MADAPPSTYIQIDSRTFIANAAGELHSIELFKQIHCHLLSSAQDLRIANDVTIAPRGAAYLFIYQGLLILAQCTGKQARP